MPALYQIDAEIDTILALADPETGELPDGIADALDGLVMDRAKKFDAICKIIRENKGREAAFQAEIDRLEAGKRVHTNTAERLKSYLLSSMQAHGEKKVETELFKLRIQRNGMPAVLVRPEVSTDDMPIEYVVITSSVNKEAIRKAHAAGVDVSQWAEVKTGEHLRGV